MSLPSALCLQAFKNCLASVSSTKLVTENLRYTGSKLIVCGTPYEVPGRLVVVAIGKASLGMIKALLEILGDRLDLAICCSPEPFSTDIQHRTAEQFASDQRIHLFFGPRSNLPNDQVVTASNLVHDTVVSLTENDLLLACVSGGGSALLTLPKQVEGKRVSLSDILVVIKLLTQAGADICELNTVRSCFDELKDGGLAKLSYPAQVVGLIISDVIGNPLRYIASGPTFVSSHPPAAHASECIHILRQYGIFEMVPHSLRALLAAQQLVTSRDASTAGLRVDNRVIGDNRMALEAAAEFFRTNTDSVRDGTSLNGKTLRVLPLIVTHELAGDASEKGRLFADLIWYTALHLVWLHSQAPLNPAQHSPYSEFVEQCLVCLSSDISTRSALFELCAKTTNTEPARDTRQGISLMFGCETTVAVDVNRLGSSAAGGRCSHFALAAATRWYELLQDVEMSDRLKTRTQIAVLAGATDGLDGPQAVGGGAVIDLTPNPVVDSPGAYQEAMEYLKKFDSYGFLKKYHSESVISPTLTDTNVMDLIVAVILISP